MALEAELAKKRQIEEKSEKYEKSNHEDNTSTIGHSKIKVCFFLLSGIACVLVFNCFLSIEGYWTSRYGSNTFNRLLFGLNVGGFLSFFAYPLVASKFSVSAINISAPIMLLVVSILTLVVGEAVDGQGTGKMVVCIGLAAAVGIIGTILQCCSTTISFKHGAKAISIFDGGFALGGVLTTLIAIANLTYFENSSIFEQTFYYTIFQVVATVLITLVAVVYFGRYPEDRFVESAENKALEPQVDLGQNPEAKAPSLISTSKLIFPLLISMCFNFSITMSICPMVFFGLGLGWKSEAMGQQIILLVFNLCDFFGKISYSRYPLKNTIANHMMTLSKVIFPFFGTLALSERGFASLRNNWVITLSMSAVSGIINGYLNSSLFHLASIRVKKRHRSNAAYLSVLAIMVGLLYGSLCNLVGITE